MTSTYETIPVKTRCEETPNEVNPLLALAELGRWVLDQREQSLCSDLGGDDIQDKLGELGLLEEVEATESCGDKCLCADYGGFPQLCLRLTDKAKVLDVDP